MLASLFARRYLFSPKSRSVINLIAALSVVAVAIPVAAMIILLSVFNGFSELLRSSQAQMEPDLMVQPRTGQVFRLDAAQRALFNKTEGIIAWSEVLEQQVLIDRLGHQATTTLRGVDERYAEVVPIEELITYGKGRLQLGEIDHLLIGESLAVQLGLHSTVGAEATLYAVRRNGFSSLLPMSNYSRSVVPIDGFFRLVGQPDNSFVLAPLRLAEELFEREDLRSAIALRCASKEAEKKVQQTIQEALGEEFIVENRDERHASFYRLIRYEKWGIFFLALMVLLIASFSVVGALSMLIIEKRDERRTLHALGASDRLIRSIFRHEGLLICLLGGAIGLLLGVGISLLQQHFGLIALPIDSLPTQSYPVQFRIEDLLLVTASFGAVAWVLALVTVRSMIKNEY
ncbi:MAG: ABC transporter permease [Alistipes sp.]|nr:ABC transporter permease [Alistipes sp.]